MDDKHSKHRNKHKVDPELLQECSNPVQAQGHEFAQDLNRAPFVQELLPVLIGEGQDAGEHDPDDVGLADPDRGKPDLKVRVRN